MSGAGWRVPENHHELNSVATGERPAGWIYPDRWTMTKQKTVIMGMHLGESHPADNSHLRETVIRSAVVRYPYATL